MKLSTWSYLEIRTQDEFHNMKTDNRSFGMMEEFKHLGTILTNQNSIQEEIKRILKSRKAYYHLVQNLLSSS